MLAARVIIIAVAAVVVITIAAFAITQQQVNVLP
jgi:hypothetical protein